MSFRDNLENQYDITKTSGGAQFKLGGQYPFCFHNRRDLNLYINPESGLGQCHYCGKGFNAVQFVMAREDCDKRRAWKILSGMMGGFTRQEPEPSEKGPIP